MKQYFISKLVALLLAMLDGDTFKRIVDGALDMIEDKVSESATTLDNNLVLPLIAEIRGTFNIPDNDPPRG